MEKINGATVVLGHPAGAAAEVERGLVVLSPDTTGGAFLAMIGAVPENDPAPPLHHHPYTDEAFYIAEGELTFQLGDRELVAGAGSFVFVPRGVVHTARISGAGPLRGILIISPGGAEHIVQPVEVP